MLYKITVDEDVQCIKVFIAHRKDGRSILIIMHISNLK